jgi:hypothetical protein
MPDDSDILLQRERELDIQRHVSIQLKSKLEIVTKKMAVLIKELRIRTEVSQNHALHYLVLECERDFLGKKQTKKEKKIMNKLKSLGIGLSLGAMLIVGCATSKVVTPVVTVNPTNGVTTTNYVTNTVVNPATVAIDSAVLQLAFTAGIPYVLKADPALRVPLQDVNLVLVGVLNGGTTNSVAQLLSATGQTNAALAAQLTPLIAQVSTWEQAELAKFGSNTYGQIVIPEAKAVSAGITAGLAAPLPQ